MEILNERKEMYAKDGIRAPDLTSAIVGLGGLAVTCSSRDPRYAYSNPTKVDGFFSGCKNPEYKSSERDFKLGVPSQRFQAR